MTRTLHAVVLSALWAAALVACVATSGSSEIPTESRPQQAEVDDEDTIPCGPRLVLQNVCQRCHRKPPIRGAPFPLVTRSNITRVSSDGEIRQLMIEQLTTRRMPLAPETIDEPSRAVLLDWLNGGAPSVRSQECVSTDAGDDVADVVTSISDAARDVVEDVEGADDATASDAATDED